MSLSWKLKHRLKISGKREETSRLLRRFQNLLILISKSKGNWRRKRKGIGCLIKLNRMRILLKLLFAVTTTLWNLKIGSVLKWRKAKVKTIKCHSVLSLPWLDQCLVIINQSQCKTLTQTWIKSKRLRPTCRFRRQIPLSRKWKVSMPASIAIRVLQL